ncbi:MAG: tetratricopeptide repeat protein [Xenococcaceae cyanobacterium]
MVKTPLVRPLGLVLQKAGLISEEQLAIALKERNRLSNLKLGEILAMRGWIKLETAHFFAEQWPKLLEHFPDKPLGQYLKAAALLNESQIKEILQRQEQTGLKFGSLAVASGSITQSTLDFFLEQLDLIQKLDAQLEAKNNIDRIEKYILKNKKCNPVSLLKLYQIILHNKAIKRKGNKLEQELINSGLVSLSGDKLILALPIYSAIFDQNWIKQKLNLLQSSNKIRLKMFGIENKASSPHQVLKEVKNWTGNQPLLNQKVYQIIRGSDFFIAEGQEARFISKLIQTYMIDDWRHKSLGQHLQEVSDRLLQNKRCFPIELLRVYQKIWLKGEIAADNSLQQAELLNIGLIRRENNRVTVANRIYHSVFNQSWIEENLARSVERKKTQPQTVKTVLEQSHKPYRYRKIAIVILVWLMLIGSMAVGMNFWFNHRERKIFKLATRMLQQGEYEAALFTYDQVLKINRLNYQAWHNRGYALAGLKQYQQMLQSCASATEIEPTARASWNCQGEALHNLARYQEALAAFEQAIVLDDREPIFWLNLAESLLQLKKSQSAETTLNTAIALLEKNQANKSNSEVTMDLAIAWTNKGRAFLQQQKYARALNSFKQALNYDEDYLLAQWGKAIALQQLGLYSESQVELGLVLRRSDLSSEQKAITLFYQGLNFCEVGAIEIGVETLARSVQLNPDDREVQKAKARCVEGKEFRSPVSAVRELPLQ